MPREPTCPVCGHAMLPTTGGSFCPSCGHQAADSMVLSDGPPTPRMGMPAAAEQEQKDFPETLIMSEQQFSDGIEASGGSSIFESNLSLEARGDEPGPAVAADPYAPGVSQESELIGASGLGPVVDEEAGHATVVIPGRAPSVPSPGAFVEPEAEFEIEPEVEPEAEKALVMPRCKTCGKVLELEEIADSECAECREAREERASRRRGRARRTVRLDVAVSGTLAACAVTWAGVLVIIHTVQSDPGTWKLPELVLASSRTGLVLFCLVASILWAYGRAWAGGVALALGPVAAALAVLVLREGAFIGDLSAASAWVLAGVAGLAVTLSAIVLPDDTFGRSRRGGAAAMRERSRSGRSKRKSRRGGRKLWPILGGIVALGGGGVAVWRLVLLVESDPSPLSGEGALWVWMLGAAALTGIALALRIIIGAGGQKIGMMAILAVALVGPLPAWLALAPPAARKAGTIMSPDDAAQMAEYEKLARSLEGAEALPEGGARVLGIGALRATEPWKIGFEIKVAAGAALGVAFLAGLLVLLGGGRGRRKSVAAFAVSWAILWGAGLATALWVPLEGPSSKSRTPTVRTLQAASPTAAGITSGVPRSRR